MQAQVIDIWVGGETQCSSFKDAIKKLSVLISSTDQFKINLTYRKPDNSIGEITIREYPNKIVYIESNI